MTWTSEELHRSAERFGVLAAVLCGAGILITLGEVIPPIVDPTKATDANLENVFITVGVLLTTGIASFIAQEVLSLLARRREGPPAVARLERRQVVCSWCNTEMRPGFRPATHSICEPCRVVHFPNVL
jgi:hypothetical protein